MESTRRRPQGDQHSDCRRRVETSINQKENFGAVHAGSFLSRQAWRSVLSTGDKRLGNIRVRIDSRAAGTVGQKEVARAFKMKRRQLCPRKELDTSQQTGPVCEKRE